MAERSEAKLPVKTLFLSNVAIRISNMKLRDKEFLIKI